LVAFLVSTNFYDTNRLIIKSCRESSKKDEIIRDFLQIFTRKDEKAAKKAFYFPPSGELRGEILGGDTFVKIIIRKIPKLHICFSCIFAA
jgi:hypothetical protein